MFQVVQDLKAARQRQAIAKRETKGLEQKVESLTRKLYTLANDTKQADESFVKASNNCQLMTMEQTKLDKVFSSAFTPTFNNDFSFFFSYV